MTEFKDFAVTGELVAKMPTEQRYFTIIAQPRYEPYPTPEDPEGKKKEKLALDVELSNGQKGVYYPNRTSARKIAALTGKTDMNLWVGVKLFWGKVLQQQVAGQIKDVPYITDLWPLVTKA